MEEEHKTYLGRNFIAWDQGFNAAAGGNEDCTISGRLGYLEAVEPSKYTNFIADVVDITFYSVDGKGHCHQAFMKTQDERYLKGHWTGIVLLGVITVLFCIMLIVPVWVYSLTKGADRHRPVWLSIKKKGNRYSVCLRLFWKTII